MWYFGEQVKKIYYLFENYIEKSVPCDHLFAVFEAGVAKPNDGP